MNLGPVHRAAYLRRLGFPAGIGEPTAEVLRPLQVAHLRRIPFENLDIHLGVPIDLDAGSLLQKLTARHRGGFCYELNGAFALLLEDLGYEVQRLEARVYTGDGEVTIPFDHLVLRVVAEGRPFLVDVGFGDNFDEPVPFVTGVDHVDPVGTFRIEERARRLVRPGAGRRAAAPLLADAPRPPRLRRSLRVAPDLTGLALHAEPGLHPAHDRRSDHAPRPSVRPHPSGRA